MSQRLQALYGLKWNPFSPELPLEAIYVAPRIENFCWRIENALVREGGFAMVHGEPGTGKSVVMRVLDQFKIAEPLAQRWDGHMHTAAKIATLGGATAKGGG